MPQPSDADLMPGNRTKLAIVTGANRGNGLGVVRELAHKEFTVLLGSRELDNGVTAAQPLIDEGLEVVPVELDVTDQQSVETLRDYVTREFGKLDVLVNNAGVLYDDWESVTDVDFETVRKAFETNTIGAWRMCLAFLPLLRKSPHARIVNVSSESGSLPHMGGETPAYSVSKVAMNALTRMLAAELKPARILVNSVCPGWVATDMGGVNAPRSIAEGAKSVIWAALLPDDGPTGGFFRDGERLEM